MFLSPTVGMNGAADHGARVRIARLRTNWQCGDAALGNKAAQCSNVAWWPHHASGNREPVAAAPSTGAHILITLVSLHVVQM